MAKIKKKNLFRIGFEAGEAMRLALLAMTHADYAKRGREAKLQLLQELLHYPEKFYKHEILGDTAQALQPEEDDGSGPVYPKLKVEPLAFNTYGKKGIEAGAFRQMEVAARLPVTVGAALMPDAHQGYGLPIGGVLATENSIIPYAVGVDIGCRMCMSVYQLNEKYLGRYRHQLEVALKENTVFGMGKGLEKPKDHEILERKEFDEIPMVKALQKKAWGQLGSSGSGNHFVEFGITEIFDTDNDWGVEAGKYLAVLSHSGSRGLGANIAGHYTKIAMDKTRLPREAKQLAWLDLDTEAGQEYWLAMNLAGDYASACHHVIHERLAKAIGETPMFMLENHHNFAWKEIHQGRELIVHRKGATPAAKGELGIIPGSMTLPGFIVRGKGNPESLMSASHGAGRLMSRARARSSFTRHQMKKVLRDHGISLIGGGLDEAPMVYKNIHEVMASQTDLVEVLGSFLPKIVRMAKD